MTEEVVVRLIREHFEELFPRACPNCRHRWETFRELLQTTKTIGNAISYDAEFEDWTPDDPMGVMVFVNCSCGTTLALSTADMELPCTHMILRWVRAESMRRNVAPTQIISSIRDQIFQQVLSENVQLGQRQHPNP